MLYLEVQLLRHPFTLQLEHSSIKVNVTVQVVNLRQNYVSEDKCIGTGQKSQWILGAPRSKF